MAIKVKEITADVDVSVSSSAVTGISSFNGKQYYASLKRDSDNQYIINPYPSISSNKTWCRPELGDIKVSSDGKSRGKLIKITCDRNTTKADREALVSVKYETNWSQYRIKVKQSAS